MTGLQQKSVALSFVLSREVRAPAVRKPRDVSHLAGSHPEVCMPPGETGKVCALCKCKSPDILSCYQFFWTRVDSDLLFSYD